MVTPSGFAAVPRAALERRAASYVALPPEVSVMVGLGPPPRVMLPPWVTMLLPVFSTIAPALASGSAESPRLALRTTLT